MNYSKLPICFVLMLLSSCVKEITSESIGVVGSTSIQSTSNLSFQVFSYNEFRPNFLHKSTMEDSIKGISSNGFTPLQQNVNNAFPIDAMVNLGRILFYDKNLSLNGQVSCGSCHIQSKAFTDGKSFSVGFNNHLTERSTMSIQNMDFINNYQWQSAVQGLPDLVTKPLLHPTEMGNNSIEEVVNRVKALNYYEPFHSKAFGHAEIQAKSLIWALSSFVGSIYSVNSKFDKQLNNFTDEENLGMTLFNGKAKCGECHTAPTFAAPDFAGGSYGSSQDATSLVAVNKKGLANNGLNFARIEGESRLIKIPTLRNIEYTAPYMHDGKFKTLEEVIENYDHNIQYDASLDEKFVDRSTPNPHAIKLHLTVEEKKALKAFLLTLSDAELLTAKRYSDPFQ